MIEIEIQKAGPISKEWKKPDIAILEKAFEILKKAGFPQDVLDKSYEMLKECCGEPEEEKTSPIESKSEPYPEQKSGDSKEMMLGAMRAFMEKMASK